MASTRTASLRNPAWVGPWLYSRRVAAETSRQTIADKLGRDLSAVSRLEKGGGIPADDLPIVLAAYGVTLEEYAAEAKKPRRKVA